MKQGQRRIERPNFVLIWNVNVFRWKKTTAQFKTTKDFNLGFKITRGSLKTWILRSLFHSPCYWFIMSRCRRFVKCGQRLMSLLWIHPFSFFSSLSSPALTCLLSIDVRTMFRNNRAPVQLPVCLTHMNARTQAPDLRHTYAGIHTNTDPDKHNTHTHTQSLFFSPSLFILSFFPPCTDVPRDRVFSFLISIKVRFRTLLFFIGWLLSTGSVKRRKKNQKKNQPLHPSQIPPKLIQKNRECWGHRGNMNTFLTYSTLQELPDETPL